MATSVRVVRVGDSLRSGSTSLGALEVALAGAAPAGADPELIPVGGPDLPLSTSEIPVPDVARGMADSLYSADALVWGTPTCHGAVSGSLKNALDWLIILPESDPPYLSSTPIGLMSTAGGVQGLQAINTLDVIARALRGWRCRLPFRSRRRGWVFDSDGHPTDDVVVDQLRAIGAEVVRAARSSSATAPATTPTRSSSRPPRPAERSGRVRALGGVPEG